MTFRLSPLLLSALLVSGAAGCGGGDGPAPDVDAGDADAASRDAGPSDASLDAGDVDAAACPDEDSDGHGAAWCDDDCDDTDATRYPGATEVCDLDDEDCNDATYGLDADGDGYESNTCCNGAGNCGTDCGDSLNTVNPGAAEGCDGLDNDCDSSIDEGVCVPCPTGYTGFDGTCTDIDECLMATTCGGGRASCTNHDGLYACGCQAGYAAPAMGGTCADVDECTLGTDDCDRDPAATCANTIGSLMCACPANFVPSATAGHGASGCLLSDPSLSSLVPSAGALSPAFAGSTTTYTLTLPLDTTDVTLTPSVAYPVRAVITVDGASVASGAASATISLLGFAPQIVEVVVTTESGATRTYTVVVGRSSAYVKASNTGANDVYGVSVSLSTDGTRLAVGAPLEDSSATGVGGNQADNSATDSGAVYVY